MAFFGLFNYSKPGPGVDKNGPKKKRFFLFFELYFRKFWKMIELNLLFLVCCIPIVTIGPAIAGMTYVLRNYALEKPTFMVSDFFDAFKSNWKQGFGLFTIFAAVSVLAGVSFFWYFANSARSWLMLIPFGLCILLCLVLLFMQFYVYLMAVTVELKLVYHQKCVYFRLFGSENQPDHGVFRFADRCALYAVFPHYGTGSRTAGVFDHRVYCGV